MLNAAAYAADQVLTLGSGNADQLTGHISHFLDRSGHLSQQEIVARWRAGDFQPAARPEISAGFSEGALWLHLRVAAAPGDTRTWWLDAAANLIDRIEVYIEEEDGSFGVRHGGRALPFAQREIDWHNHAFRLPIDAEPRDIFIRYASTSTLRVHPRFFSSQSLDRYRMRESFLEGLYLGIMGLTFLIGLFRTLRHRGLIDAAYTTYLLSLETMNFVHIGWLQQLGLSDSIVIQHRLLTGCALIASLAILVFHCSLIRWPARGVARYRQAIAGVSALYLVLYFGLMFIRPAWLFPLFNVTAGLVALWVLCSSAQACRLGYANAGKFLAAFSPFMAFLIVRTFASFGILAPGLWSNWIYMLATLVHAILLLAAVFSRDEALRQEKEKLEWQLEQAQQTMAEQSLFIRTLAHEVRTPLAIIDTNTQLLEMAEAGQATDKLKLFARIRASVKRVSLVLERLIHQDQLSSHISCERRPVELREVISESVQEIQSTTEQHLLRVAFQHHPLIVIGDRMLLKLLLTNLLENAVRYSPEGGAIEIRAHPEGENRIIITVSDEGVGIPEEMQERIFERYYRTDQVTDAFGVGLGLHIVQKIAHMHGGEVSVESELDEGSCFTVTLPASAA